MKGEMEDNRDQRPVSAPAGSQYQDRPIPSPIDASCSISLVQEEGRGSLERNQSADNTSNNCSQADSLAKLDGTMSQLVRFRACGQISSDGPTDSSDAARELYKLMSDLNDCRDMNESRGECCHHLNDNISVKNNLLYCSKELLKLKDFSSEIRASMDVEQFVHQAELILDMREVSVDDIVQAMLEKAMSKDRGSASRMDEAKGVIFVPNSSMLLARTIQGMSCMVDSSGRPVDTSYDQSWLCALCSLAQISQRHMVVARFKQPINMADNAHEVRLFALMVTPSKDKDTKSALETGRTFATMLTNVTFRKRLLDARSETEFKSLMMLRAQQLSKTKKSLKNRHKYMLGPAVNQSISSLSIETSDLELGSQNKQLALSETCHLKGSHLKDKVNLAPSQAKLTGSMEAGGGGANDNQLTDKVKLVRLQAKLVGGNVEGEGGTNDSKSNNNNNNISSLTTCSKSNSTPISGLFSENHRTSNILELISQTANDSHEPNSKEKGFTKPEVTEVKACSFENFLSRLEFGKGLWADLRRRIRHYPSDFRDAIKGPPKTIQKTVATIWFLYFSILLPTIAFSALNTNQTHGHMGDLRKAIIGQAIGGLGFALFGGQPLVIIMTTAPLCLYTKVVHQMCLDFGFHFPAMYAAVGLWNGFFLCIYSLLGFSRLMKWCTRSTEEIFALFIVIAFISDASKDLIKNFQKYYNTPACEGITQNITATLSPTLETNSSLLNNIISEMPVCRRETSLLFVLLMLGTLWLATTLYRFRKTPYLEAGKRELLADYALPAAVIIMSFFGSYIFDSIYVERFPPVADIHFERAKVELLPLSGMLTSIGLGFTLSLLFFMDQNISAAMVNAPQNGLKKSCAYHFDLLVVGILNGFLALYGLPMMHGVLPHSPLHVRSLADIEERVEEGHLREVIVNVRETRVTGIVSHILVLGSLYLIPYPIAYIPTAVLNGLFLYMAVTSLDGLQMFERILLLFTEQSKYPPNHYIRRCPQRKIHQFTMLQLFQLLVMCMFGFSPYNIVEMFFPVIILLMIPFRHKIVPKYINEKYLDALDGKH